MTMRERIMGGKLFTDECEGLPEERTAAKKRMKSFNESSPENPDARIAILNEMLGKSENIWIEPPFYFCYGTHIYIGEGSYINFNCNFIDDGIITIGKRVMFGAAVTIATVGHPICPDMREYVTVQPRNFALAAKSVKQRSGRDASSHHEVVLHGLMPVTGSRGLNCYGNICILPL